VTKLVAVQAHRGSPDHRSGVRENTLDAFARARSLGADSIELDVRLTADGGLAVHHDPVIEGAGPVHELATSDLPDHVPLLSEALEACAGMVVNIEVKNLPTEPAFDPSDRCTEDVVALVTAHDVGDSVIISSFWPGALAVVRCSGPNLATGLLVTSRAGADAAITAAVAHGCAAVHLPIGLVSAATVDSAHAAGLAVAAWTVADESVLASVLDAGVDTVITDDVSMARRAVDRA